MSTALDRSGAPAWRDRARQMAAPEFVTPAVLLAPSIVLLLVVVAFPMVQGLYPTFSK